MPSFKMKFSGVTIYRGRIFHFPIDFEWALQQYVQRYCAAYDSDPDPGLYYLGGYSQESWRTRKREPIVGLVGNGGYAVSGNQR